MLKELIHVVRRQACHKAAWSRQFARGNGINMKTLEGLIVEDEKLIQASLDGISKEHADGKT